MLLFAVVCLGVGGGVLALRHSLLSGVEAARSWQARPCTIERAEFVSGEDGRWLEIDYSYEVDGTRYSGDRLDLLPGSMGDDGPWEEGLLARNPAGSTTTCWVDPEDASSSVLDREHGPGSAGNLLILAFPFSFVGLFFLYGFASNLIAILSAARSGEEGAPARAIPELGRPPRHVPLLGHAASLLTTAGTLSAAWAFLVGFTLFFVVVEGPGHLADLGPGEAEWIPGEITRVTPLDSYELQQRVYEFAFLIEVDGSSLDPVGREMKEKPTLILLHGGPGFDQSEYRPELEQLGDIAQVIFLDHRGQGRSDASEPAIWNLTQWADDLFAFCEALEIDAPVVLGHSFGGMVAQAYAERHPDHPSKLILAGTYAKQNIERSANRFEQVGGPEVAEAARQFWTTPTEETIAVYNQMALPHYSAKPFDEESVNAYFRAVHCPAPGFHFFADEMKSFDFTSSLGSVRCPTLVLGGELDPVCTIEDQEDIAAALPAELVRFERLANCSHVFWKDAPEPFFAALRSFIAG